jgi:hypothetical protein
MAQAGSPYQEIGRLELLHNQEQVIRLLGVALRENL